MSHSKKNVTRFIIHIVPFHLLFERKSIWKGCEITTLNHLLSANLRNFLSRVNRRARRIMGGKNAESKIRLKGESEAIEYSTGDGKHGYAQRANNFRHVYSFAAMKRLLSSIKSVRETYEATRLPIKVAHELCMYRRIAVVNLYLLQNARSTCCEYFVFLFWPLLA